MKKNFLYKVQEQLKPANLNSISDNQINNHWELYIGYVNQVNQLTDQKRYGFEYNGMILHEYYFENLSNQNNILENSDLFSQIEKKWGNYENWLQEFINTGKTRGIGWAILYADPNTGNLINCFVHEHQNGNIAGFVPILVMDVWEHAYMVDHDAGGRADYINSFIKNINWAIVEKRYKNIKNKF